MRILLVLFSILIGQCFYAQSLPTWIYHFSLTPYYDSDLSSDGDVFSLMAKSDVPNCSSTYSYSFLLNTNGNLIWENAFDTLNGCVYDYPNTCSKISSPFFTSFSICSKSNYSQDSNFVITYNANGSFSSKKYVGIYSVIIGDMGDGHVYFSPWRPASIIKTDTLGNTIWSYLGPDSNNLQTVFYGKNFQRILIGCEDYSSSITDDRLRIIGVDTTGTEQFNTTANIFLAENEYPEKIWFTADRKIVGISSSSTNGVKVFSIDTLGNFSWSPISFAFYRDAVFDANHNILHFLGNGTSSIKKCYKIDCTSGQIVDSIVIDSIMPVSPKIKVDTAGNLYLGYMKIPATAPTFRVERFNLNYWFDWIGEVVDGPATSSIFEDMKISDSGMIYLFYRTNLNSAVCKFAPPLISSTNELPTINNRFALFPNPANSAITIKLSENTSAFDNSEIQIQTLTGQICKTIVVPFGEKITVISIEDLPSGMYFVQVIQDGISGGAKKLIIQH